MNHRITIHRLFRILCASLAGGLILQMTGCFAGLPGGEPAARALEDIASRIGATFLDSLLANFI